jgi:hypothetical protein
MPATRHHNRGVAAADRDRSSAGPAQCHVQDGAAGVDRMRPSLSRARVQPVLDLDEVDTHREPPTDTSTRCPLTRDTAASSALNWRNTPAAIAGVIEIRAASSSAVIGRPTVCR